MLFGSNGAIWPTLHAANVGQTAYLAYNNPEIGTDGVPEVFGAQGGPLPAGVVPVVCFKPHPGKLLAGELDAQLRAFLSSAPAPALLCAWQEGNEASSGFTAGPGEFAAMAVYLQSLARQVAPGVLVGQKFGSYPVQYQSQDLRPWVAPGLAWYGVDGYQRQQSDTPEAVFGASFAAIDAVWAPSIHALIGITETNSSFDKEAWFSDAYEWAERQGHTMHLIYSAAPGVDGPDPGKNWTDAALPALEEIARKAALA